MKVAAKKIQKYCSTIYVKNAIRPFVTTVGHNKDNNVV